MVEVVIARDPLKRLVTGMRIIVTAPRHPLYERRGRVVSEWPAAPGAGVVAIDGGLPDHLELVLAGQPYHDRTVLLPQHCRELR